MLDQTKITEEEINKRITSSPALANLINSAETAQKVSEISEKYYFDIDPEEDLIFHQLVTFTILGFITADELGVELKNRTVADDAHIRGAVEELKLNIFSSIPAPTSPAPIPFPAAPITRPAPSVVVNYSAIKQVPVAPPLTLTISVPPTVQTVPVPALSIPPSAVPITRPAPGVVNYSAAAPIAKPTPAPIPSASPFIPPAPAPIIYNAPVPQPAPTPVSIKIEMPPAALTPSTVPPPAPLAMPITTTPSPIPQAASFNPQASASAPINPIPSAPAPFIIHTSEEVKSNVDINLDTRGTTRPVFYKPAPSTIKPAGDYGQPTVVRIDTGVAAPANRTIPPPVPRPLINSNLASAPPTPPPTPTPPIAPKPPIQPASVPINTPLKPNLFGAAPININVPKPATPIRQETLRPKFGTPQTIPSSKINPENIIDLKDLPR